MKYVNNTKNDEKGFASITIALVIVLVLSLITVGFAQLARREQQSALNKQLASQAQYAAESGINDVIKKIESGSTAINSPESCLSPTIVTGSDDGNIIGETSRDVSYTCALADLNPNSLVKDLDANSSWYTTFRTAQQLSQLKIEWKNKNGDNRIAKPTLGSFSPSASWGNSPAVLQVNITPLNSLDRNSLITNSFTVYLYPSSGGDNDVMYSNSADKGQPVSGRCNATSADDCSATISGLDGYGNGPYLLHIVDYYDSSNIVVTGTQAGGTTRVNFENAQAKIDVTGKARNVLKRLQVRVPLSPSVPLPAYAIEAQNICKRLQTTPGSTEYKAKVNDSTAPSGSPCDLSN